MANKYGSDAYERLLKQIQSSEFFKFNDDILNIAGLKVRGSSAELEEFLKDFENTFGTLDLHEVSLNQEIALSDVEKYFTDKGFDISLTKSGETLNQDRLSLIESTQEAEAEKEALMNPSALTKPSIFDMLRNPQHQTKKKQKQKVKPSTQTRKSPIFDMARTVVDTAKKRIFG